MLEYRERSPGGVVIANPGPVVSPDGLDDADMTSEVRRIAAIHETRTLEVTMRYADLQQDMQKLLSTQNKLLSHAEGKRTQVQEANTRVKELELQVRELQEAQSRSEFEALARERARGAEVENLLRATEEKVRDMQVHIARAAEEQTRVQDEYDRLRLSLARSEEKLLVRTKEHAEEHEARRASEQKLSHLAEDHDESQRIHRESQRRAEMSVEAAAREKEQAEVAAKAATKSLAKADKRLAAEKSARRRLQEQSEEMLQLLEKHQASTEGSRAQLADLQREVRRLTAEEGKWARKARAWERDRSMLLQQLDMDRARHKDLSWQHAPTSGPAAKGALASGSVS